MNIIRNYQPTLCRIVGYLRRQVVMVTYVLVKFTTTTAGGRRVPVETMYSIGQITCPLSVVTYIGSLAAMI